MSKSKKQRTKKPKNEGRSPVLAPFADEGFNIFASYQGKEFEARVRKDGVIVFKDKEYATPNAAANASAADKKEGRKPFKVNGWLFWRFKKNGEEVPLDAIRGSKSPLKAASAKPRTAKKANGATKKARAPRKPRLNAKTDTASNDAKASSHSSAASAADGAAA